MTEGRIQWKREREGDGGEKEVECSRKKEESGEEEECPLVTCLNTYNYPCLLSQRIMTVSEGEDSDNVKYC